MLFLAARAWPENSSDVCGSWAMQWSFGESDNVSGGISSLPGMLARGEREALLGVVELYAEGEPDPGNDLDRDDPDRAAGRVCRFADSGAGGLVDEVSDALELLVRTVSARSTLPPPPSSAAVASLGGAEMVMRAEFVAGRTEWLPRLLPSFAYLATVAFLDREEALRLAEQVGELARSRAQTQRLTGQGRYPRTQGAPIEPSLPSGQEPTGGRSVSLPTRKWKVATGPGPPPGAIARTLKVSLPRPTR